MCRFFTCLVFPCLALFASLSVFPAAYAADSPLAKAEKLVKEGLHKDALELIKPFILDPQTSGKSATDGLNIAVQSLQQLNRLDALDELLESFGKVHKNDWQTMQKLAETYLRIPHDGYLVDGKFLRGNHRSDGRRIDRAERDRIQALKIFCEVLPRVQKEEKKEENGKHAHAEHADR
ncbi:MAG: hypothetical protein LBH00_08325 [Planctomycetaceae bacterium]|jgi:hypothetical protein|nr:hypothetical protein [Planctomycetaceae bacterium]